MTEDEARDKRDKELFWEGYNKGIESSYQDYWRDVQDEVNAQVEGYLQVVSGSHPFNCHCARCVEIRYRLWLRGGG